MNTVHIPANEYQNLLDEIKLLKNTDLLEKVNRLIDLLYEDRYGLYLGEYTEDLTEYTVNNNWQEKESGWDAI